MKSFVLFLFGFFVFVVVLFSCDMGSLGEMLKMEVLTARAHNNNI